MPDPATFPLVTEAVRRREAGESLGAVAAYLSSETGRTWQATSIKRLVERHGRYRIG